VNVSTVVLATIALALPAVAHVSLQWWVRRRERMAGAAAVSPASSVDDVGLLVWLARAARTLLPPVALLIWIHGAYWLAVLLLQRAGYGALTESPARGWIYGLILIGAMFWLLARLGGLADRFLVSLSTRADTAWDDIVLPLAGKVVRRALPLLAVILGVPALSLPPAVTDIIRSATSLLLIAAVAFVLLQLVNAAADFVLRQHRMDVRDNLQARSIHTQVIVLKKVALTAIAIFTLASMLMVFESVRQFGASILASAGIAGIVIGFAAQRSIATLLAGFQIALTQPIRVDDVVIVEGEWGRIEDITLTYVVVRVWDLRRLVVPITYFIEQPFQNWTRSSSEILATVFLCHDYTIPLEPLRAELTRILKASPSWDGKVNVLQVTDAKADVLEVRALASAADASLAWNLRCEVREKLIGFVQRQYPDSLPRVRASVDSRLAGLGAAAIPAPHAQMK
jgi:small-conductance mechanosensitive channel